MYMIVFFDYFCVFSYKVCATVDCSLLSHVVVPLALFLAYLIVAAYGFSYVCFERMSYFSVGSNFYYFLFSFANVFLHG